MKDLALQRPFLQIIETTSPQAKNYYGLRKLFTDYLGKLNVPFYDSCCPDLTGDLYPVRYNDDLGSLQRFNGTTWESISSGGASASAANTSAPLLTEASGVFSFNGPKMTSINNKELFSIYKMPAGNLTNDFDNMVKNDAMTTATIAVVGGYDQVIVTGTTNASYIRFDRQLTLNRGVIRLKVRVDAIGATAPLVGVRGIFPTSFGNFANSMHSGHINLLTGVVTESNMGTQTLTNGWSGAASIGEIIEIEYRFDYLKGSQFTAYKANGTGGEISTSNRVKTTVTNSHSYHQWPAIVLSDGTYTILNYEILAEDYKPKVLMAGDSMSCGQRILYEDSICGRLESKIPYRVGCVGSSATVLAGMIAAQLWEIQQLRPEWVVIVHYLDPLYTTQAANPADPDYAAWDLAFKKYVNTIKSFGCRVIFVHPQSWTFLANSTQCGYYTTYLTNEFPTDTKILVPDSQVVYDSTAFHYAGATNGYIADQIVSTLVTASSL